VARHGRVHSSLPPARVFAPASELGSRKQISISPVQRLSRAAVTTPSDGVFIVQWFVTMIAAAIIAAPTKIVMLCPISRIWPEFGSIPSAARCSLPLIQPGGPNAHYPNQQGEAASKVFDHVGNPMRFVWGLRGAADVALVRRAAEEVRSVAEGRRLRPPVRQTSSAARQVAPPRKRIHWPRQAV
jgi:hypothetical protein